MKTTSFLGALIVGGISLSAQAQNFPTKQEGFLWGVANAAFQVEGRPLESDWSRWTHQPGKISDGTTADIVTDFWNTYDEDFKLAQDLGANAFRISIAWERIEPKRGEWDDRALAHYEQMIVAMRKRGLEPVVTLHHFVLPGWLANTGGLLSPDFVPEFADYAEHVVKRLSAAPASVTYWMTLNEPMVLVNAAYMTGEWPPGQVSDPRGAIESAANLARAHIAATARIRALNNPALKVSVATHYRIFEGKSGWIDGLVAKFLDWVFNRQFLSAVTTGRFLFWMPGGPLIREKVALPEGRSTLDYFGMNFYGRTIVEALWKAPNFALSEGPGPKTDIGWEMNPQTFYEALKDAKRYNLPILVTENGLADHEDKVRADFIRWHLESLTKARNEGVPIIGYLHWSLTDNFEWAKGLSPRFGLVAVEYGAKPKRKPRPSFEVYKSFIH